MKEKMFKETFTDNKEFMEKLPEFAQRFSGLFSEDFDKEVREKIKEDICGCAKYFFECIDNASAGYSWAEFKTICKYIAMREKVTRYSEEINYALSKVKSPIFKFFGDIDPNIEWRQKLELKLANKNSNNIN